MSALTDQILALADGRPSKEIAAIVKASPRYVRRVLQRNDAPRLSVGARRGAANHQYVSGRRIDHDGYVIVTAPDNHPYARQRTNRPQKLIFEHRLVMEQKLGRYLDPSEIVDHIDGLTLHNAPENLRLFESNAEHLRQTITGKAKMLSPEGHRNILRNRHHIPESQRVDSYTRRRKAGDVRLRQILLAALSLGTDSPYLSGTHHHTRKAGIDLSCRSTIERALADLYERWAEGRTLL